MAYIFLDESWRLRVQKENSRNYFNNTFLYVDNKRTIEKKFLLTHKSLKKIHKKKGGVLHCIKKNQQPKKRY
jgi:hypothetical protein